jgi:hypothetical protein
MRLGFSDEKVGRSPELRDCIEAVLAQSERLIGQVFDGLRVTTTEGRGRVQAIHKNAGQRAALDALLSQESAAKQLFRQELRNQFFSHKSTEPSQAPGIRFDDFQFLDDFQIDANIEIAVAQQEVAQQVDAVLPTVHALISSLLGMVSVQPQLNPIRPEAFVQAMRTMFKAHVADDGIRSAMLSSAAHILGRHLEVLYKDLIQWLRSQGVEPALPAGYAANIGKPGSNPEANKVSRTMLTLDKLKRLLTGGFDAGLVLQGGPRDFLHTVPASYVALEDLKLVEPMMKRLTQRAKEASAKAPDINLLEADPHQNREMGRQLGGEVVRLMVENLSAEDRLLPRVRSMLKELEPRLLQLAKSDPRFFSDRKHPARVLMDRVTHRSLAFPNENAEGFSAFAKAVSNAIQVLGVTGGDAPSFARVLRKLEDGWAREDAVVRKRQEEAARSLMHAEQRNLLAQKFTESMVQKLDGKDVPDHVSSFLRGPWAQVLAEAQLRADRGAADPAGFAEVADDLVWSVQVQLTRRNKSRLVQLVPVLLVKLRLGLQLIDYPEERIPLLFDNLIAVHEQAFEQERKAREAAQEQARMEALPTVSGAETGSARVADGADQISLAASDGADVDGPGSSDPTEESGFWLGESEASESGYLAEDGSLATGTGHDPLAPIHAQEEAQQVEVGTWAVADLKPGSWVEIYLQGEWIRAQLTWASPHLTLFMFVSGAGLAHSMSRRTMEQRRASGLLRIVSDGDLVGDALDAVAQTALMNQLPPPTGPAPLE